jgi:hypothetical protein
MSRRRWLFPWVRANFQREVYIFLGLLLLSYNGFCGAQYALLGAPDSRRLNYSYEESQRGRAVGRERRIQRRGK